MMRLIEYLYRLMWLAGVGLLAGLLFRNNEMFRVIGLICGVYVSFFTIVAIVFTFYDVFTDVKDRKYGLDSHLYKHEFGETVFFKTERELLETSYSDKFARIAFVDGKDGHFTWDPVKKKWEYDNML